MRYTKDMNASSLRLSAEQQGFASIVIALIMVLVLSLTTVGFAQLMRREQRSALDKQLTNQAYYAAETGINDATQALNSGFTLTKSQCQPYTSAQLNAMSPDQKTAAQSLNDNSVGGNPGSTGASYSCLIINPHPDSLQYTVDGNETRGTELTGATLNSDPPDVQTIGTLEISWQDHNSGDTSFAPDNGSNYKFGDATSDWNYTGMLKTSLTPLSRNAVDRNSLITNTFTAFLYPNQAGSPADPGTIAAGAGIGNQGGAIVNGNCHRDNLTVKGLPRYCNVKITGLNAARYLLTLSGLYQKSDITITAYATAGVTKLSINDAQVLVDSTGKAQDVLRRVQVRVPAHNDYDLPAGTTGTICKQLALTPGTTPSSTSDCPIN